MQIIIRHLHTYKITFLSFCFFKNRFCKHCFRSFWFGLYMFLLQSKCFPILVENCPSSAEDSSSICPNSLSTHFIAKP